MSDIYEVSWRSKDKPHQVDEHQYRGKDKAYAVYNNLVEQGYRCQIGNVSVVGGIGMSFIEQQNNYDLTPAERGDCHIEFYRKRYPELRQIKMGTKQYGKLIKLIPDKLKKWEARKLRIFGFHTQVNRSYHEAGDVVVLPEWINVRIDNTQKSKNVHLKL
jgi:hypothetical protein